MYHVTTTLDLHICTQFIVRFGKKLLGLEEPRTGVLVMSCGDFLRKHVLLFPYFLLCGSCTFVSKNESGSVFIRTSLTGDGRWPSEDNLEDVDQRATGG